MSFECENFNRKIVFYFHQEDEEGYDEEEREPSYVDYEDEE